ncbi:MAG: YeaH/YhbH family protein [Hyphomicrobiales bacterium]|nr:YeaH/YhbH family protein [Hyphomicrobiales bacterium]
MHIIDRRLNPKGKSLGNRQRFVRRGKADIREAVKNALQNRKVHDVGNGENIRISSKSIREPSFSLGRSTGKREYVLPGNKEYRPGDTIAKPKAGEGDGGSEGTPLGEGHDEFVFTLTKDEFLDIFFEDLALPNMVKTKLKDESSPRPARAGFATDGSPGNLNRTRTMRHSLARRISLQRPKSQHIQNLEEEIALADEEDDAHLAGRLREEVDHLSKRMKTVAYIDPCDLRYNRFERVPRPTSQAVMFCLMDASASMTQAHKDLAKRFFMLLYVFLSRQYRALDLVFVRHTQVAMEVDEETFFRGTETGGTVVSSALEEMQRIVQERYPVDQWNIYAAQASDGDNFSYDMAKCVEVLEGDILPISQYFAYIEVGSSGQGIADAIDDSDSLLWEGYAEAASRHPHFAMRHVTTPSDIFPVFQDLFSKHLQRA